MKRRLLLAAPLGSAGLLGCALRHPRRPAPAPVLHAVLGPPYRTSGIWRYPRASYDYDETGLAVVAGQRGGLAADGAAWDPGALMGAHQTLQLPCMVRVTNLETGRQILLRLDDRGPGQASRLLAVTPRAALLLGPGTEPGVRRVRVQVEDGQSRQLTARFGDLAPALAVVAAPTAAVQSETLPPPPGASAWLAPALPPAATVPTAAPLAAVSPSPESVSQLATRPTALWIDAGGLGQPRYAELLRARLGGLGAVVVRDAQARPELAWRVRIGPLPTVAAADATLDRVLRAGVVDARIIVQ